MVGWRPWLQELQKQSQQEMAGGGKRRVNPRHAHLVKRKLEETKAQGITFRAQKTFSGRESQ